MKSQVASMMKSNNISLLVLLLLGISACGTSKKLGTQQFSNHLFSIAGVDGCKESHSGDAVDSQIGEIICEGITFSYDYGRYGARGPSTAEENFRAAFDTYHYTKFFELTYIDAKVQPIFRDSVEVVKLHKADELSEQTMFDCSTCNAVAELKFKGKQFYFPTTVNQEQLKPSSRKIKFLKAEGQMTKLYETLDGKSSAVISEAPARRHRDFLAITIKSSSYSKVQQEAILSSIRLLIQE